MVEFRKDLDILAKVFLNAGFDGKNSSERYDFFGGIGFAFFKGAMPVDKEFFDKFADCIVRDKHIQPGWFEMKSFLQKVAKVNPVEVLDCLEHIADNTDGSSIFAPSFVKEVLQQSFKNSKYDDRRGAILEKIQDKEAKFIKPIFKSQLAY